MKRSTFLKTVGTLFAAPSAIASVVTPEKEAAIPKKTAFVATRCDKVRLGDMVVFQDGKKAVCVTLTTVSGTGLTIPRFVPVRKGDILNEKLPYTIAANAFK